MSQLDHPYMLAFAAGMPIPALYASRYVYHFTHLENLQSVLTHGFLSVNEQKRRSLGHTSIAEDSIQARRARMNVPCGPGGCVHDYVPLYFGKTSPMLLKQVRAKNVDQILIIYFAFPIALLERADVVFTSAAANTVQPPTFFTDPSDLDKLNWSAIDSRKWGSGPPDDPTKQARMAEALVYTALDPQHAAYLVVWNPGVANKVREIYASCNRQPPPIQFDGPADGGYYFSHFRPELPADMRNHSIASGPIFIKKQYKESLQHVLTNRGKNSAARFRNTGELLAALRADLAAIPQTAELVGLESDNEVHTENVGNHTLRVVQQFLALPTRQRLTPHEQVLVELAAYLHDIGKGPKSRWVHCGGKQQVDADHPLRSVQMLERILTEELATISDDEARILCKLVCYHDLYGDIVSTTRGRRREQLVEVAENERDLEMLIAIGRADMSAVDNTWGVLGDARESQLRTWVLDKLRGS